MQVDAKLQRAWQEQPDKTFRLIVRVSGDLEEAARKLQAKGLQVRRRCKLINGLVVESTGAQAASLLDEPWVLVAERDAEVRALNDEAA